MIFVRIRHVLLIAGLRCAAAPAAGPIIDVYVSTGVNHFLGSSLPIDSPGVTPDQLAVKAAHARGMEIWGMGSLWDWGAAPDTPGFGDYPFCYESKLRLEHPEWAPADKHGTRQQGGPIELAYPEARKALIDLTVKETLKAGYDGICFLTYVENYSLRCVAALALGERRDPIACEALLEAIAQHDNHMLVKTP